VTPRTHALISRLERAVKSPEPGSGLTANERAVALATLDWCHRMVGRWSLADEMAGSRADEPDSLRMILLDAARGLREASR
jgi:hypothetical protein